MSTNNEPYIDVKSEDIQEIINRPPPWLVRCGNGLFFFIALGIAIATYWIHYPDIIKGSFILTATNAPLDVITKFDGKLTALLIADGDKVAEEQILGYLESTASAKDIILLSQNLGILSKNISNNNWAACNLFSQISYTKLGEIQSSYELFFQRLTEMKSFLPMGVYEKKRKIILEDQKYSNAMEMIMEQQAQLLRNDLRLAQEEFVIHDTLFKNKAISNLEYKREKAKLLAREMPVKSLETSIIQSRVAQLAKQKELIELENAVRERRSQFVQALYSLQSNIQDWKQKYLLTAPAAGRVSFVAPIQTQQHFTSGQAIMRIESDSTRFQGLVKLPQSNLGKVEIGQRVLIKLDGFPYREYGMLEGRLLKVSTTPGADSVYWGFVALPEKLITLYSRPITYRNGMVGQAEIVTANRRLASRLLSMIWKGSDT